MQTEFISGGFVVERKSGGQTKRRTRPSVSYCRSPRVPGPSAGAEEKEEVRGLD